MPSGGVCTIVSMETGNEESALDTSDPRGPKTFALSVRVPAEAVTQSAANNTIVLILFMLEIS